MSTPFRPSNPPEVFVSYAHKDEDLFEKFEPHLEDLERRGIIKSWHGRKMVPGDDWEKEISEHLDTAEIFLLMVSVDFLNSKYCLGVEFERARERHALEKVHVIPVILRPCKWKETPLGQFEALPKKAKPVVQWKHKEDAFVEIADGITQVVKRLDQASRNVQVEQEHRLHIEPRTQKIDSPTGFIRVLTSAIGTVPKSKFGLVVTGIAVVIAIVWLRPFGPYVDLAQPSPSVTPVSSPSPSPSASPQALQIVMTEVPPFDPVGGDDSNAKIAGRVPGAKSGEYVVVIYSLTTVSKTKTWYVQPEEKDPETEINPDGGWSAEIHTGTNYAVLLVPPNYHPPPHTSKSPIRLPGVITSIEFEGKR